MVRLQSNIRYYSISEIFSIFSIHLYMMVNIGKIIVINLQRLRASFGKLFCLLWSWFMSAFKNATDFNVIHEKLMNSGSKFTFHMD